jgi:hypothetical protein
MTVKLDGTCVCDKCGAIDPSKDMKLSLGWTRKVKKNPCSIHPDYLHYCPKCSAERKGRSCNECRKQAQTNCVYGMAGVQRTYDHPDIAENCKSFGTRRPRSEK